MIALLLHIEQLAEGAWHEKEHPQKPRSSPTRTSTKTKREETWLAGKVPTIHSSEENQDYVRKLKRMINDQPGVS